MAAQSHPINSSASTPARKFTLADVSRASSNLPNRHFWYSMEGWGKTSLAAQIPGSIFVMTRQETGLLTLMDSGLVAPQAHFPEVESWASLLGIIDTLTNDKHDFKALTIDVMNGAERLCHEHVCRIEYGGEWGEKGFMSYQRGYDVSVTYILEFLQKLDRLRTERNMSIVLLNHCRVVTYKNPEGPDFDQYAPDLNAKTFGAVSKWADVILFGKFEHYIQGGNVGEKPKDNRKGKAATMYRELCTVREASHIAKNRLNLPTRIPAGDSAAECWANLKAAIKAGRIKPEPQPETTNETTQGN